MTARQLGDKLLPFLTGVVLGVLGTVGTFAGRVASLETIAAEHTKQLDKLSGDFTKLSDEIITILRR